MCDMQDLPAAYDALKDGTALLERHAPSENQLLASFRSAQQVRYTTCHNT